MIEKSEKNSLIPPYVSYKALMVFLETLRRGIPSQIDRSLMRNSSGTMQTQLLTALRFLKLIDHQGHPEPKLSQLVNADGEDKSKVLEEIVKAAYPSLFNDFDLTKATSNQFRQKFAEAGSSGESIRKGMYFFLAAAKEANIDVSPYVADPTPKQGDGKPRKVAARPTRAASQTPRSSAKVEKEQLVQTWEQMLLAKFPSFDPAWPDEVKKEWLTTFQQMMKMSNVAPAQTSSDEEELDNQNDDD